MKFQAAIVLILMCVMAGAGSPQVINSVQGKKYLVLGKSKIEVPDNSWVVGAQVDRVFRDIHSDDPKFGKKADPFRIIKDPVDLVPYMEGMLAGRLMEYAHVRVVPLTPAEAVLNEEDGRYYAYNGSQLYVFSIDPSKTEYETAEFSGDRKRAVFVDTHGFNMVVGPAIKLSGYGRINLAIACMDLPSKAQAALRLARNGISCFGPCDRFISDILGYKRIPGIKAEILGTAPVKKTASGAVIGDQPVMISLDEPIIAQTTDRGYPDQYCDTPGRYFKAMNEKYGTNLNITFITANVGETDKLVKSANEKRADVIGARVFNEEDAKCIRDWLKESQKHRVILFHSAPYSYGHDLFFEFPAQAGFGDPDPVFE